MPIKENQFLVDLDLFYVMNGNVCLLAVQLLIKHSQQNNGLNYDLSLSHSYFLLLLGWAIDLLERSLIKVEIDVPN